MHMMALAIIPIAISVHTIVSFDFSMAVVPMWHSTIFGPYFVVGAIFSGIAALNIVMAIVRKALHLESIFCRFTQSRQAHARNEPALGYFVFNERLVTWYGNTPHEMAAL
jgi:molybdopterin-containing oxidoreductase family membrane subunit